MAEEKKTEETTEETKPTKTAKAPTKWFIGNEQVSEETAKKYIAEARKAAQAQL